MYMRSTLIRGRSSKDAAVCNYMCSELYMNETVNILADK